ncbi:hypothetical protein G7Z17_g4355 [Cylindrodendrum hubeiense]|uniref:Uncharacterized protein n=1 Tax=Cylindrodendrum hubeiense TaxID=595255 RepID=A0A9P5HH24_9HYPO|nr:hypothetical protein G7Z17_g4355 [Cylindrodendrum hubeiense]
MSPRKPKSIDPPTDSGGPSGSAQHQSEGAGKPPKASKKTYLFHQTNKEKWLLEGTGDALGTLHAPKTTPSTVMVTKSGGYDLVCSYSWVKSGIPTVYVPEYPFEVVFRAMEVMNPNYKFDDVDVLINRNTLRKLFKLCCGQRQGPFKINLFGIANTMIVERCEATMEELIRGSGNSGWGFNFESAVTQPGLGMGDISGHHRVLRYDFGGLSCAVRFEVDACYGDPSMGVLGEQPESSTDHAKEISDLSASLKGLQVQSPPVDPEVNDAATIRVISRGSAIPHTEAAEIKSMKRLKPPGPMMAQLWFGRTQNLIRGVHSNGAFNNIHVNKMEENLQHWETEPHNQATLRKVATILSHLRDIVKDSKERACVAVASGTELEVFDATQRKTALPQDICEKFWSKK